MEGTTEGVAHASRSLAGAGGLDDVCAAAVECFAALGLRGAVGQFNGDGFHIRAMNLPDHDTVRVEEVLGRSLTTLRFPTEGVELLRALTHERRPVVVEAFPARFLRRFPHLSEPERRSAADHLGAGPLLALPVEAGDTLVGAMLVWGGDVAAQRPLLELMAVQAGMAWRTATGGFRADVQVLPRTVGSADLGAAVREVITPGGLRIALQPVTRLVDRAVMGYEALTRFVRKPGGLQTPDELFAAATATSQDRELLAACLTAGFAAGEQARPATLFVNVSVATLMEAARPGDYLRQLADDAGLEPSEVVLEVSEKTPIDDLARLARVVAELRGHGFRIAIDDAGAGYASMLVIAELRPEFIKIDRRLISTADVSAARRALVVSLLSFGAHINARVIAEGVESEEVLQTLLSIGVQYGQGWHLGRPVMLAPARGLGDVIEVSAGWFKNQKAEPFLPPISAGLAVAPSVSEQMVRSRVSERMELSEALIKAATALQSEHDPRRIIEVIAEQLLSVVQVDDLCIYAADEEHHCFTPVYANGDDAKETLAYSFSLDMGMTGWAFALGTPQYVGDSSAHPSSQTIPGTPVDRPESVLLIPLIAGDRRLGMLNCRRLGLHRYTAEDLEAAALFGYTAAAAWRNAELYAELSERATTDPLTGLLNSRWLRDVGERELAQSRRTGRPLATLLIDLDHFKQINDTGGHGAGDVVLRRVASELLASIRAGDACVRLGGEEFLVVLRDTDEVGAMRVADQLRRHLSSLRLPRSCLPRQRVTASIGVAVFRNPAWTLDELVRAADVAMYEAKRNGRDRVVLSGHEPEVGSLAELAGR
ncbi:MAG: hypothetical protein NVSMB29_09030 [Candidatus Dormibacteria bacterium]